MPTISLTVTAAQAARLADAVGWALRLGQAATNAQMKAFLVDYLKGLVRQYERAQQEALVVLQDLGDVT